MYINFLQNQVKTQVMTEHTSLFAKNCKLHKFATTNNIFFKSTLTGMHHHKKYMHINFSKIGLVDRSEPCTQIYLHNIASCRNLPLPIVILKKKILNMHHHKMYMSINFQ